jgi:hypothetical protein
MPAKLIVTAVAVALVVAGGIVAVDAGVAETGELRTFSETASNPTAGTTLTLNQSNLDSVRYVPVDALTVTDENGTLMIPGEDFSYDRANGTITPLAGGRLAGDSSASVEYGLRMVTSQQEDVSAFGAGVGETATAVMFVTVIAFVVAGLYSFRRVT